MLRTHARLGAFIATVALASLNGCLLDPAGDTDTPGAVSQLPGSLRFPRGGMRGGAGDAGNVDAGLLADMTSMGTLYSRPDNWWNLEVDQAPLDPNSATIIAMIADQGSGGRLHPDFTPKYGI